MFGFGHSLYSHALDQTFIFLDCSNGSGGASCCAIPNQCGVGEGDCDFDSVCSGNLKCGVDNCDASKGFPATFDCCYDPNIG